MAKNNFLLVDLNQAKTKKLAETITSDTSRKILNYLTEKDDSEASIAKNLAIPISTVHYHLQKLQEAGLVTVDEFHYSQKGREINHYKLANKYIIIAPKKVVGLKEKLKGILPVGLVVLGISAIIKFVSEYTKPILEQAIPVIEKGFAEEVMVAQEATLAPEALELTANAAIEAVPQALSTQPDIALWFLIGGLSAIILYVLYWVIRKRFS